MKTEYKQRSYQELRADILADLKDPRHGTSTVVAWSYNCPCDKCKKLKGQIIQNMIKDPNHELHGTRRGFVYGQCRCSRCVASFADKDYIYRREYNWKRIGVEEDFGWDDFMSLLEQQESKCAVCGEPLSGKSELDHNHKTGQVRGIVHHKCNIVIGMIENQIRNKSISIQLFKKALKYIQET